MNVDAQDYLALCEQTGSLVFWDIEATGLRGDYNSILCVSFKPYGEKPFTYAVKQPGNDQRIVREAKATLERYRVWCGYYSKGFDAPMLNTRLLKWGVEPVGKKPHIDLYFTLKASTLTARRSQGHLLSWLEAPEQKMSVSADVWNSIASNPKKYMPTMVERCESDTMGLEALYKRTKHLVREVNR